MRYSIEFHGRSILVVAECHHIGHPPAGKMIKYELPYLQLIYMNMTVTE
jgi:hypothetical protein